MATKEKENPKKGGIKQVLIASVGVSMLGFLGGFFIAATLLVSDEVPIATKVETVVELPPEAEGHSPDKVADAKEIDVKSLAEFSVVPMQPVVTNLADSSKVWVRLESSVLINTKSEPKPDLLAVKLSQHVLAYLRTLKLSNMQGAGAIQAITQDLNEIVTTVSEGQAQGLLISGLVFE